MKYVPYRLFITIFIFCVSLIAYGQSVEHGIVKEYKGIQAKQPLAGVEVMVKGAPSSISDKSGNFSLRFTTLVPGDKVVYSDIYKDGYVIFNKDALDAWRISNSEKPFTIVMCKESDFRALKKKFYGIIEKSYKAEYEKQKAIAERSISNEIELTNQLNKLKNEYNEKLGNINTYVELFSRIDRSEMDSIEAKSLHYIELNEIDKAIETYEELQISRQIQGQISKWDSGKEMVSAGNRMIEQVKSDLMTLVDKMQKQIGLYEMGGKVYNERRKAMIEEIIPILYRLNQITEGHYNETLGQMIIERSKYHNWSDRMQDYREAASLPSVIGLSSLGRRMEMLAYKNHEYSDSARVQYEKILELCQPNDSTSLDMKQKLVFIPKGVYKANDGNEYPFGLWGERNAEAYLCGRSGYVSTHLEGDVTLPDEIVYNGKSYPVTAISYFAFGNNKSLRKVTLPKYLKMVAHEAFVACNSLDTIIAPPTLDQLSYDFKHETIITFPEGIKDINFLANMYDGMTETYPDAKKHAGAKHELLKTLARESARQKEHEVSKNAFRLLITSLIENGDTIHTLDYAKENVKLNGKDGELYLGYAYDLNGDCRNAAVHYKKALKTGNPAAYNCMAYLHVNPKFGPRDFRKAHEYLDIAIDNNRNDSIVLPNLLDSKGEILLMEGKEEDAKKIHSDIIAFSPDFYDKTESVLHKHFNPAQHESVKVDTKEYAATEDPTNLQHYMDLIQLVARKEYFLTVSENFRPAEYEELLSIGIIAMQVMIKNKTPEQIAKYNTAYISTAISWAIRNEMRIRYDWYSLVSTRNTIDSKFSEECRKLNIDPQQLSVLYAIYIGIKDLYHTAIDYGFTDTSAFKQIKRYWDLIHKAKKQMNQDQKAFVDFYLSRNSDVAEIEKRFDLNTIVGSFNIIREIFNANNEYGYGIAVDKASQESGQRSSAGNTDNSKNAANGDTPLKATNKQIQPYLDIVKLVADNEMRYLGRFGLNLDKEELISIGIIAVQVMIKNKTPEQLAKYNTAYLGTVITWAIRNELRIRHKKYSQSSAVLDFTTDDQNSGVRMTVYHVLKDLYNNPGNLTDSKVVQEINEMMGSINKAKSKLSGSELECAEYFFDKNSIPADITARYSESQIINMLDAIKKECRDNDIIQKY